MATRGMAVLKVDGTDYTINDPNLAEEFSTLADYKKGQYVNYQGDLYRFRTNHSAGSWNSSHVKKVSFSDGCRFSVRFSYQCRRNYSVFSLPR